MEIVAWIKNHAWQQIKNKVKRKPGIIKQLFLAWRIKNLTAGEVAMNIYLKYLVDELSITPITDRTNQKIKYLQVEMNNTVNKIADLQQQKKKLYLKFL